jgi:hypothetical protein
VVDATWRVSVSVWVLWSDGHEAGREGAAQKKRQAGRPQRRSTGSRMRTRNRRTRCYRLPAAVCCPVVPCALSVPVLCAVGGKLAGSRRRGGEERRGQQRQKAKGSRAERRGQQGEKAKGMQARMQSGPSVCVPVDPRGLCSAPSRSSQETEHRQSAAQRRAEDCEDLDDKQRAHAKQHTLTGCACMACSDHHRSILSER